MFLFLIFFVFWGMFLLLFAEATRRQEMLPGLCGTSLTYKFGCLGRLAMPSRETGGYG